MHSCAQTTWVYAPSCFLHLFPQLRPNHWLETTSVSNKESKIDLGGVETKCKNALMMRLHCGTSL